MKIEKVNDFWVPSNDVHIEQWKSGSPFTQNKCLNKFIKYCESQTKKMKTVIDVGAWCGTWAKAIEPFAKKVIAFEPDQTHFECLQRNCTVNCTPRMEAVGAQLQEVSLTEDNFTQAKRVDEKGNIIPVDFGIMGRLDKNNRQFLAEILYGFIQRDYVKVAEVHFKAGLVPQNASKEEFAQALRSVGEPIFGQTIKDISGGNLLAQLFEITEKFNMPTQTPLLLLQKTMVVVEGVSRKLYPETNIWEVSRPILEDWIKDVKSPKATLDTAIHTSAEIIKRIPDFPDLMDKANYALQLMAEGKLNLGTRSDKNLEIEQMRLKNFRNNLIITFFGIVILALLVF